jgi:hypothetical protein
MSDQHPLKQLIDLLKELKSANAASAADSPQLVAVVQALDEFLDAINMPRNQWLQITVKVKLHDDVEGLTDARGHVTEFGGLDINECAEPQHVTRAKKDPAVAEAIEEGIAAMRKHSFDEAISDAAAQAAINAARH